MGILNFFQNAHFFTLELNSDYFLLHSAIESLFILM